MFCPFCYSEVTSVGCGDESIDVCEECDAKVEGVSLYAYEVMTFLEDDLYIAVGDWRNLVDKPEHSLKWKRNLHAAEESMKRLYDEAEAFRKMMDWRDDL